MTIDRWFAPGVGIVKDITTMQDAKGDLLQRISLELAEAPKIVERPEVKSDSRTETALGESCERSLREADDDILVEHAGNLRALAGPAFAARRKRQGCVDRGKHRRRFSSRIIKWTRPLLSLQARPHAAHSHSRGPKTDGRRAITAWNFMSTNVLVDAVKMKIVQ